MSLNNLPSLSIVIPFLNEEIAVDSVLAKIFQQESWQTLCQHFKSIEVIAVDDGSTDKSADLVRAYKNVKYFSHKKTLGYGSSLKTGFSKTTGDYVVFLDMDSSYSPDSIIDLYVDLIRRELDMIYGFRLCKNSKMPFVRKAGNRFFALVVQAFFPGAVTDVCTGMRLFRSKLLADILKIQESGLNFSMSLTMVSLQKEWKIGQISIPYLERDGFSKLNVMSDGLAFFWIILKSKFLRI